MADKGGTRKITAAKNERISFDDVARLQRLIEGDLGQVMRYWVNVDQGTEDDAPIAWLTAPSTTGTPARAEVLSGLMAQPQIASVNLLVQAGAAMVIDTVTSPDSSPFRFAISEGVQTGGVLTFTPNSAGSTRIDIVEFALAEPAITETASRQVQNEISGIFAAQTVNKLSVATLQFRIRLGTPGSGLPALAAGWVPMMVASVPNGATTWDGATCWDVRPLLADYAGPTRMSRTLPVMEQARMSLDTREASPEARLRGVWTGRLGHRKIGGRLGRSSPGVDAWGAGSGKYLDLAEAANQELTSGTPGALSYLYLYLIFPYGLPRWCRYTDAAAATRRPRGQKGLLFSSTVAPNPTTGVYSAGTPQLHGSYGFATLTDFEMVSMGALWMGTIGGFQDALVEDGTTWPGTSPEVLAGVPVASLGVDFTLLQGIHFPVGARRLRVVLSMTVSVAAGTVHVVDRTIASYRGTTTAGTIARVLDAGGVGWGELINDSGAPRTMRFTMESTIPPHYLYPTEGGNRLVRWLCSATSGVTPLSGSLSVSSWDGGH